MIAKIKKPVLMCLALLLLTSQSTAGQEETFNKFVATYSIGHEYGGTALTLKADGSYISETGMHDGTEIDESGTYIFSEGVLRFTIIRKVGKNMRDGKELNLFNPEERKEMYGEIAPGDIDREFQLLPVTWSERIYLIEEKELDNFANAINLGLEPRWRLSTDIYFGTFYLRKGDEQKKVSGHPSLPAKLLSFLLTKPVTATVTGIVDARKDNYSATTTATIDKGSADGLKVGMRLIGEGEEPSPWGGTMITSVEEKTAVVRTEGINSILKIGDILRTRDEPKLDEYGALNWDEEKARLGKFAARLEPRPHAQGYVIAYAGRRARPGEAQARADRARAYLENELKMESGRIVAVDGGYRENQTVELFAVPAGKRPPVATPTLDPAEVRIIKRKAPPSKLRR
ncbi:MAG TPA: hypothetical protein VF703_15885 [Pyrinomonadaceae bacterium]|jgi:hypothetical protein